MTVTELAAHQRVDRPSTSDRWRPTRAGIINIWRYYGETFSFHEGRLLLRGPNGTGKSRGRRGYRPANGLRQGRSRFSATS